MMKHYSTFLGYILLFAGLLLGEQSMSAQCLNSNVFFLDLTPTTVGVAQTTASIYGGEYVTVSVCNGATYTFSTVGATYDTQITVYNDATGAYLTYDDDGGGNNTSFITWTSTFTGTVRVLVNQYNCATNTVLTPLSVTQTTACAGGACLNNNLLYTDLTPITVGVPRTINNVYGGEYCTATVCAGATYTFSTAGATYDTQITVYNDATGSYLAYDDDGGGNNTSFVTWTATYSGVVRILVDQYQCTSNSLNTPLAVTQITACPGVCSISSLLITDGGCEDTGLGLLPTINTTYNFNGACSVSALWLSENGGAFQAIDLTSLVVLAGETIQITDLTEGAFYTIYYELSDGSTSLDYFYSAPFCTTPCTAFAADVTDAGCADNGNGLLPTVDVFFDFIGACTAQTLYVSLNGGAYVPLDITTLNVTAGMQVNFFDLQPNTTYQMYYGLSNGTTSPVTTYFTGVCETCSASDISAVDGGCYDSGSGLFPSADLTFFIDGTCLAATLYLSENSSAYEAIDVTSFGIGNGGSIQLTDLTPNAVYTFYFTADNGTSSALTTFISSGPCAPSCAGLNIQYASTGCEDPGDGTLVPGGTITANYIGGCTVEGLYTSTNGGAFEYLDLSAFGFGSGDAMALYFNNAGANYSIYYVLSDGSFSPVTTFVNETCESGVTVCDCAGTQVPEEALVWLGDGFLDEGASFWNGVVPVDFNCATWGFDCGDGLSTDQAYYDPYGVCSGALPPASGCVDEFCYNIDVVVALDCYNTENSVYVFNENQDVVMILDANQFTAGELEYTYSICLPAGCYTFRINDSYGDGMSGVGCNNAGYFYIVDQSTGITPFYLAGGNFTSSYSQTYCVGPQTTCDNLSLSIETAPCFSAQGAAVAPAAYFTFDFDGPCTVNTIYLSANGGDFQSIDVTAEGWGSGDTGELINLLTNTDYQVYYTTNDGATSFLYNYSTTDCNNEITICDCEGTTHTIGVLAWLGDGFADNGTYSWDGQNVNFNCTTWGYDCSDIAGAPTFDPYGVCDGGLPPFNGCGNTTEVLGCTDPTALNFNPDATVNDGSCIFNASVGCTNQSACNYNPSATIDNGTCEFISCAGCTDQQATNYDETATIDDGTCIYEAITGCTDVAAINYNPIATEDDGSCIYQCVWPSVLFDAHCSPGDLNNYYIEVEVGSLGNGAPYTISNSYNQQQLVLNLSGSFTMGPFPNNQQVVIYVTSFIQECSLTSTVQLLDCNIAGAIYGCMDPAALNYNGDASLDDGSCVYTSVEEEETTTIVLYPNPANDRVLLSSRGDAGMARVRIMDATGRVVYNEQRLLSSAAQVEISTQSLAAGNYVVEVSTDHKVEQHQLIIQH